MKKIWFAAFALACILTVFQNCAGFKSTMTDASTQLLAASNGAVSLEQNVMVVQVGQACGYVNTPCVSVVICVPGTSNCQTISNIALETTSGAGLRIFQSALTLPLPLLGNTSGTFAECRGTIGNRTDWGKLASADVYLGNAELVNGQVSGGELASVLPIQVIDPTFATLPSDCMGDMSSIVGINGYLSLGPFQNDCGSGCTGTAGFYYACGSSGCTHTGVPEPFQVSNPISRLAQDNNGVIFKFPSIPGDQAISMSGFLVLGIGTRANNTPPSSGLTVLPSADGSVQTTVDGATSAGYLAIGDPAISFPSSTIAQCSNGWFCPTSLTAGSIVIGIGAQSAVYNFSIDNASSLFAQSDPNWVFDDLGAPVDLAADEHITIGFPFFLGKAIYIGIAGSASSIGSGPLFAF